MAYAFYTLKQTYKQTLNKLIYFNLTPITMNEF